jgi:hypothetical protein
VSGVGSKLTKTLRPIFIAIMAITDESTSSPLSGALYLMIQNDDLIRLGARNSLAAMPVQPYQLQTSIHARPRLPASQLPPISNNGHHRLFLRRLGDILPPVA